jgi:hypothetical protein
MDVAELASGAAIWLLIAGWLLNRLGSALPRATLRRLGMK